METTSVNCPAGSTCRDGVCRAQRCSSPAECPGGGADFRCQGGECRVPPAGGGHCPPGQAVLQEGQGGGGGKLCQVRNPQRTTASESKLGSSAVRTSKRVTPTLGKSSNVLQLGRTKKKRPKTPKKSVTVKFTTSPPGGKGKRTPTSQQQPPKGFPTAAIKFTTGKFPFAAGITPAGTTTAAKRQLLCTHQGECPQAGQVCRCRTCGVCGPWQLCVEGRCEASCVEGTGINCPAGQTCAGGRCTPEQCEGDLDCGGSSCVAGRCVVPPSGDGKACPPGQEAAGGHCREAGGCHVQWHCPRRDEVCFCDTCGACMPWEICFQGRCVHACVEGTSTNCPAGAVCKDGVCGERQCRDRRACGADFKCQDGSCKIRCAEL